MLFIPEIPVVLAFGLGATELIIILVIILIIFGAGKLPKVMQSLGTGIKSFKKAAREEEEEEDTRKEKDNAEQAQIEEKEVKNLSSGEKVASEEATESKKKQEVEA